MRKYNYRSLKQLAGPNTVQVEIKARNNLKHMYLFHMYFLKFLQKQRKTKVLQKNYPD